MPKTIPTTDTWESQKTSALPQYDALSTSFRFAYALGTFAQKSNTSKSRSELETSKSRSELNISESRSAPSTDDQVSPCIKQIFPSISHKSRSGSTRTVTRGNIPLNCLVLDSGATVSILANIEFLKNIFTTKRPLTIHCGGDSIVANQAGSLCDGLEDLPLPKNGYFHHKNGLANLLSLGLIAKEFRVVLDTSIDNAFYIFNDDGSYIRFECQPNGLYYLPVEEDGKSPVVLMTTVAGQKSKFSELDCKRAEAARELQARMGFPSDRDLIFAIEHNIIRDCSITRRDVKMAKIIYGPNVNSLKGKSKHRKSKLQREDTATNLPSYILKRYWEIALGIDVVHMNGMPFLLSISKHIKFIQIVCLRKLTMKNYLEAIQKMRSGYQLRGFHVRCIFADRAFECLRHDLEREPYQIPLTTCGANQHVDFVEKCNQFVKERVRSIRSKMPFTKIPTRFLIETVYSIVTLMNSLPRKGGVHPTLSTREIIKGISLKGPKHRCGEYVQAHVQGDNTIEKERTEDALYLRPDDNQKGHIVFKLNTKQPISVGRVTPIPMPQDIIDRVNAMGKADGQPDKMTFGDRDGNVTILDIDEYEVDDDNASDDSYNTSDDDDDDEDLIADEPVDMPPPVDEPEVATGGDEEDSITDEQHVVPPNEEEHDEEGGNGPPAGNDDQDIHAETQTTHFGNHEADIDNSDDTSEDDSSNTGNKDGSDTGSEDGSNTGSEVGSVNAEREARNLESNLGNYWSNNTTEEEHNFVMNTITEYGNLEATLSTPQYGFSKGLKVFGEEGRKAAIKELDENLIGRNVVRMLPKKEVTKEVWKKSLAYLMFLKRKRCGKIKARGCADGRPQREYITKEESSSPTVSIYALFASCVIDAIESRAVITCDIPGAFLQADYPEGEDCYIRFEGTMVKLICDIRPEYKKYVWTTAKGRTLLFGKLRL